VTAMNFEGRAPQPEDSANSLERRLFERFGARFPAKFEHSANDFGTDVFLRDASAKGIKFLTKERLYLHDIVSLEIELPDGHEPMILNGRVIRIHPVQNDLWEVGVEFHKVHLMKVHRMYKLVSPE